MSVTKYSTAPSSNTIVGDGGEAVNIDEGMARGDVNNAMRAIAADIAKDYKDCGSLLSSGSGAALSVSSNSEITALSSGLRFTFKAHEAIVAGATLNLNGIGARALKVNTGAAIEAVSANVFPAGAFVCVVYNGVDFVALNAFLGATTLNGQTPDFYRNASNLNAGTVADDRLNIGVLAGQILTMGSDGKLPAVDGSKLTGIETQAPAATRVSLLPTIDGSNGSYRSGGFGTADGLLRVWGDPTNGNLGQGSHENANRSFPIIPAFPPNIAGSPIKWLRHAHENIVLMDNGDVWSWGQNGAGVLGHGNTAVVYLPKKITALDGVNIVDVGMSGSVWFGNSHAAFLADSGELYTCGYNAYGQLGDGTNVSKSTPVLLAKTDWAKIFVSGAQYACTFGIDASGSLYSWGFNGLGVLGDGSVTDRNTPTFINAFGGTSVSKISSNIGYPGAYGFSIALLSNGKVYTWGYNGYGQLGTGNTAHASTPQEITSLGTDNVAVFTADGQGGTAYVQKSSNEVYASGYNLHGQLSLGDKVDRNTFSAMVGSLRTGKSITQVLPRSGYGYGGIAILYDDGVILCAGYNGHGQCGVGTTADITTLQEMLISSADKPVKMCLVGTESECSFGIMTEGGKYYQTGYAGSSQLPEDDGESSSVPFLVQF